MKRVLLVIIVAICLMEISYADWRSDAVIQYNFAQEPTTSSLLDQSTVGGFSDGIVQSITNGSNQGIIGSAWYCDGVHDYITFDYTMYSRNAKSFSIWIKSVQNDNESHTIIGNKDNSTQNDIPIRGDGPLDQIDWHSLTKDRELGILKYNVWDDITNNSWSHIVVTKETGYSDLDYSIYVNGVDVGSSASWNEVLLNFTFYTYGICASNKGTDNFEGYIDEMAVWDRALTASEVSALYGNESNGISWIYIYIDNSTLNLSSTGCTNWRTNFSDSCVTYDTTPTVKFDTTSHAQCRITSANKTFDELDATNDCQGGQNTSSHTCSLPVAEELLESAGEIYISCAKVDGSDPVRIGPLAVSLTDLSVSRIDIGIRDSIIWPGAEIYSDQQVFLRDKDNNQLLATVDRVAVYGNQRWLFNWLEANESFVGLFNISPAIYVLEMQNYTPYETQTSVAALINSTKT